MGVDSLVAVEVRAWFLKELAVELPVIKILSGASIMDLVELVLQKLPQELQSLLSLDAQHKSNNGNALATLTDKSSEEAVGSKTNGNDSTRNINGVNGTNETVLIDEKPRPKNLNGDVSIVTNGYKMA